MKRRNKSSFVFPSKSLKIVKWVLCPVSKSKTHFSKFKYSETLKLGKKFKCLELFLSGVKQSDLLLLPVWSRVSPSNPTGLWFHIQQITSHTVQMSRISFSGLGKASLEGGKESASRLPEETCILITFLILVLP